MNSSKSVIGSVVEPLLLNHHASRPWISLADDDKAFAVGRRELAWLASHGQLEITGTVEAYIEEVSSRVAICPLTAKVAVIANQLPADYSSDPWDRLIGATALAEGIALVTKDAKIRSYKQLSTIW
jgi:PIN domain nuclease of toxin-antitoxin system